MHTRNKTAAAQNRRQDAARKKFPELMRRRDASVYLKEVHDLQFVPDTLAKFACEGTGPEMVYVNDIPFYRPSGLDLWAKAKMGKPTAQARKYAQPRGKSQRRKADDQAGPERGQQQAQELA